MTISLSSTQSRNGALVAARVTALTPRSTALGDRIYAVFKTVDGSTLGFWACAEHPVLRSLRVGDAIALTRKTNGRLSFPSSQSVSNAHVRAQHGAQPASILVLLQRLWRLI